MPAPASTIPGFVRDTWFRAEKVGDFYGQCQELCGKEHAYMPIHVKVVSAQDYSAWVAVKAKEAAARAGVTLIGLCTGSFILARAGLLEGYVACVSWFHREEFAEEFPRQRMVSNRMFVVDRDRMTCAGGTSVVHLAAHLIESCYGRALANKSLRILIEDQPLPSSTPQPESVVTRQSHDSVVRQAMLLIEQKLTQSNPLTEIAGSLGISMRQLERRFVADVGITPRDYRLQLRLARARWMIEHTDLSVTDVGFECGFGDCSHFSRAFTGHFKVRPSSLRRAA